MKLRIVSEHLETYDLVCDRKIHPKFWVPDEEYVDIFRCSGDGPDNSGPSRFRQFYLMLEWGIKIVGIGEITKDRVKVGSLLDYDVVYYENQWQHAGRGKIKTTYNTLIDEGKLGLYSVFEECGGEAIRYVQIGKLAYEFKYRNVSGGWMANEDAEIDMPYLVEPDLRLLDKSPILAVDYILDSKGNRLACDLNFAPGTRNDGHRELFDDSQIYQSLKDWVDTYGKPKNWSLLKNGP